MPNPRRRQIRDRLVPPWIEQLFRQNRLREPVSPDGDNTPTTARIVPLVPTRLVCLTPAIREREHGTYSDDQTCTLYCIPVPIVNTLRQVKSPRDTVWTRTPFPPSRSSRIRPSFVEATPPHASSVHDDRFDSTCIHILVDSPPPHQHIWQVHILRRPPGHQGSCFLRGRLLRPSRCLRRPFTPPQRNPRLLGPKDMVARRKNKTRARVILPTAQITHGEIRWSTSWRANGHTSTSLDSSFE